MYNFSEKNIQLSNWLLFDAVLNKETIRLDYDSGIFEFEVQRADWENIMEINFVLYKSLRVFSFRSKVVLSGIVNYKWIGDKDIHQDYSIRSIDFEARNKLLNINTIDGKLIVELYSTFIMQVIDIEPILREPFLRIINGTPEKYLEWLEEYKLSINENK